MHVNIYCKTDCRSAVTSFFCQTEYGRGEEIECRDVLAAVHHMTNMVLDLLDRICKGNSDVSVLSGSGAEKPVKQIIDDDVKKKVPTKSYGGGEHIDSSYEESEITFFQETLEQLSIPS